VTKGDKSYREEDYEIEIVGDTEMDKKKVERVDRNFSKMTLKGQREAMEAFKNSTLYSTEEEEEEVEKPRKVVKRGRKRKVLAAEEDSDSDDIEILDSPNEKRISREDPNECDTGVEDTNSISITPMSTTNPDNNNKESPLINKKSFGEELNSNGQRQDLVQVKSSSGKTMMVERSKLERVMGEACKKKPLENETIPLKRPNTRSSRALENKYEATNPNKATIKLTGQAEEITLEGEAVFGEIKIDLKRKSLEGDHLSRRLRRRG